MVSFGAKAFKVMVKTGQTVNKLITGKTMIESAFTAEKEIPSKHKFKKGYKVACKETAKNSRYLIIQKESNEPIRKMIYFIHGGAYLSGLDFIYYNYAYTLCDLREDLAVVLLDYSLAPNFKYPTQINEALDVWNEITTQCKPEDIIIGGDSSGGNCTLVLIQRLAKENRELPKAAILISVMADYTLSGKSVYTNYQKDLFFGKNEPLTEEGLEQYKKESPLISLYYENQDPKDTTISPVFWDYHAFPKKSIFFAGGDEIFLSDTLTIVDKLKKNNFETECTVAEGLYHNYVLGAPFISEAKEAKEKIKSFILENLN